MVSWNEFLLPNPKSSTTAPLYDHPNDPWFEKYRLEAEQSAAAIKHNPEPPQRLKRQGFVPRKAVDFGDGGAFPEIHIAQYPLDMGRDKSRKPGSKTLPVTVDSHGNVAYDAIVKQNENSNKIVYSQHKDLVPKVFDEKKAEDVEGEIEQTTLETKAALDKILNARLNVIPKQSSNTQFIKYTPSQRSESAAFNSGAKERIIKMVEMQVDPLEPPKFRHKKIPKPSQSIPVPVLHSPPRPISVKDLKDWKIPPCISNWKNRKGYTIPLDKRLAADGRGLQEVQINDKFAKLSESLYVAEQKAREAVAMRSKVQKEMLLKEKEQKEQELRALAQKARSERTAPNPDPMRSDPPKESSEEKLQRDKLREERKRERERERRLEAKDGSISKKSKITRDRDRDISEKVALGMASTGAAGGRGGEVMYDTRLFNQEKGMNSGFGTDDQYNVYDKKLFNSQPTLSTLYRPKKDADGEIYGDADKQMEKILKTDRFKPDKGFSGASDRARRGPRDGPVQFEKEPEEADPFGLDKFLNEVKKGTKAMDKVGSGGTMRACGGSSMRDGYEGGGSRTRIGFERRGR